MLKKMKQFLRKCSKCQFLDTGLFATVEHPLGEVELICQVDEDVLIGEPIKGNCRNFKRQGELK